MHALQTGTLQADIFTASPSRQCCLQAGALQAGTLQTGTIQAGTIHAGTFPASPRQQCCLQAGTRQAGTFQAGTFQAGALQAGTIQAGTFPAYVCKPHFFARALGNPAKHFFPPHLASSAASFTASASSAPDRPAHHAALMCYWEAIGKLECAAGNGVAQVSLIRPRSVHLPALYQKVPLHQSVNLMIRIYYK